jgi:tRNA pseudouridine55 synthase
LDSKTDFTHLLAQGSIIPIYKPLTWTSFDTIRKIKGLTKKNIPKLKIGHAGTLDPLAEGLLIICTQAKTKSIEEIQAMPKTYIAKICLGANRPSYDKETEIIETFDISAISQDVVQKTIMSFEGIQDQIPPIYSAVKQDGKPLYLKARKGESAEIKAKQIHIHRIHILDISMPYVSMEVVVSKGTYIRSLAFDIGAKLGCGAYLDHLLRKKIGEYDSENAWTIEELESSCKAKDVHKEL